MKVPFEIIVPSTGRRKSTAGSPPVDRGADSRDHPTRVHCTAPQCKRNVERSTLTFPISHCTRRRCQCIGTKARDASGRSPPSPGADRHQTPPINRKNSSVAGRRVWRRSRDRQRRNSNPKSRAISITWTPPLL